MYDELYGGVDLLITFMRGFRVYGISLYDVVQWSMWIGVAFVLVWFFFATVGGSND